MAWACFAASWPGLPTFINGTMKSYFIPANSKGKHQDICLRTESQENVGHEVRQQPQAHKSFYQRLVKEEPI